MGFALFISIIQSILFLGHWFFYITLIRFFGVPGPGRLLTLRLGLALLSISLVLTSFLAYRYSNLLVRYLYTTAAAWLGIFYLFILAAILCWIFYGIANLFRFSLDRKILFEILIGVALIGSVYGFVNGGVIRVTQISLQIPHLPSQWKGKTAVWISDTHLGQVRGYGFSKDIASRVERLHPDILFIGGDLYDGLPVDVDKVIEPFSRLTIPHGIYFITGNHEEFFDNTPYLQAVRHAGIRVLYNEKVELDGFQIIGVDYRDSIRREQFRSILQKVGVDRQKPSLLLKHSPLQLQVAQEEGITLQLSGHTHRGQVFLFRFITSWVYHGYDYGLKKFGDLVIYTSSGAGTWGPPMRLDTKPEIVFIKFM
jgi:predicted MPP superfamily phosphohydrolase